MSHSLIGADRGTHTKIVAVALMAATVVMLVGILAREPLPEGGAARLSEAGPVVRAGKPAVAAALAAPTVR
jgi:voltage-gated potassium channel Kch